METQPPPAEPPPARAPERALIDDALHALDRGDNLRASQLLRAIPQHADPALLAMREALREQLGPDPRALALIVACAALWLALAFWVL
jgi:hypothetical protein